jgi:hypothetical protein
MNPPQRMRGSRALKGASLLAALILVAAGGMAVAGTDSTDPKPPKPTSLAPHPTTKRTFGALIQPPILHKRHRKAARATGNQATATHSTKPGEAPK